MAEKQKSDLSRAFTEDGELKTHIGGQALIEGIMMRGKYNWAVAVREPDNNMYVEEHELASGKAKNSWLHAPVVRGCTALVESLMLGYKALAVSADHAFDLEDDEAEQSFKPEVEKRDFRPEAGKLRSEAAQPLVHSISAAETSTQSEQDGVLCNSVASTSSAAVSTSAEFRKTAEPPKKEESESGGIMVTSMIIGIVLGIAVFIVVPTLIADFIVGDRNAHWLLWNITDGVIRLAIFILYLWLIGRMKDIRRMFMYHGAEHKTIHCYEHGLPLTPENARSFPRLHVRCGTAFLVMVLIVAIIVYAIIPVPIIFNALGVPDGVLSTILVICIRIIFLPIIAGISYEITVRWAGSHPDNPVMKVMLWPGMQMQYLTTNEPDDSMLECAIAAMQRVVDYEQACTNAIDAPAN